MKAEITRMDFACTIARKLVQSLGFSLFNIESVEHFTKAGQWRFKIGIGLLSTRDKILVLSEDGKLIEWGDWPSKERG